MALLTIFYDGTCPLCVKEMASLTEKDNGNNLETIDLSNAELSKFPNINVTEANIILHALDDNGNLLLGLDAVHRAWQLVGRGWIYAPLRWPLIKPLADRLYILFAKNRYRISFLLTGSSRCNCK